MRNKLLVSGCDTGNQLCVRQCCFSWNRDLWCGLAPEAVKSRRYAPKIGQRNRHFQALLQAAGAWCAVTAPDLPAAIQHRVLHCLQC